MGLGNVTQLRISPHLKIVCCESFGKVEHFKGVSGGTFFGISITLLTVGYFWVAPG